MSLEKNVGFFFGRRMLNIKSQVNESLKEGRIGTLVKTYNYAIFLFGITKGSLKSLGNDGYRFWRVGEVVEKNFGIG